MVIKIFIVGFLAVHILRHLLQGTFPGQPFPMEQLQLPPGAYHTITATIDFDFSSLGQGKTSLAPAERLRQRDDLAFFLVDRDTADFKPQHWALPPFPAGSAQRPAASHGPEIRREQYQ